MDYTGEKFLDKLYQGLYMSDAVQHTMENGDKRYEAIRKYLERLERVHSKTDTESKKNHLKKLYFDKYVIKEENIPYGQDKNIIISNQKKRLGMWIDYLSDPNSDYPAWAKYWVFQGMLKMGSYDENKQKYLKRDKKTIAPFVEPNAEIIAKCIETVMQLVNEEGITLDVEERLSKTDSFSKIYTIFEKKYKKCIIDKSDSDDGIWIKYNQGSEEEAIKLYKSLENKKTGWCTASSEDVAKSQVCGPYANASKGGDFFVYYTKDKDGNYTIPRIAIRLKNHDEISEIRGILDGQNLEEEMTPILEQKLLLMTFLSKKDVEDNIKIIEGLKELTRIGIKTEKKEQLTEEELTNLYRKEYGFGWTQDPKVMKIQKKRNIVSDYEFANDELKVMFLCSRNLPHTFKVDDKKIICAALKKDVGTFIYVSENLKKHRDIIKIAIEQGVSLGCVPKEFRKDKEIVKMAVSLEPRELEFASPELKDNKEIVLLTTDSITDAIKFASDRLKDDKEVILKAVEINGSNLQYASPRLRDDKEIVMIAVGNSLAAMEFASDRLKDDKETVIELLSKTHPILLDFASDRLKEDKEFVTELLKIDDNYIYHVPKKPIIDDEETIIHLIKNQRNPEILKHFSTSVIIKDNEAILNFIKKTRNFDIFKFVSDEFKDDKEFMLKIVVIEGKFIKYASDRLKGDKEFMLRSIQIYPSAIAYASSNLLKNEDFLLKSIEIDEDIIRFMIREELKDNKEFMLKVVNINGECIRYASDRLKEDKELIIAAIRNNLYAMLYISDELIEDKDISREIKIAKDKKKKHTK